MSQITTWTSFSSSSGPSTMAWQMCYDISSLLDSSSGSQLIENFQRSVDDIFAIGPSYRDFPNLLMVSSLSSSDYQAYYGLLNLSGPIFRAIHRLLSTEPGLRYEIPPADLISLARSIGSNRIPQTPLQLSSFEYYVFRFAQHLQNASFTYPHVDSDRLDCVYVALLKDYLCGFFPPDGVFPTCLLSTGSTSTGVDHRSEHSGNLFNDTQSNVAYSSPSRLLRRELFRANTTTAEFNPSQSQTTKYADILSKSSTVLSIILDCWFGAPDISRPSSPTSTGSHFTRNDGVISSVVAVVNRIVVEHLHHFVYGPSSAVTGVQLRDFKERYVPKILDARIWIYLQHAFERWPLDFSFRQLLELWLAYIQPWRYAHVGYDQNRNEERVFDFHWEPFVKERIAFYSDFLQIALDRFAKLDLTAYRNACMIYRVAHVFGDPGLISALDWTSDARRNGRTANAVRSAIVSTAKRARAASNFCENIITEEKAAMGKQSWTVWLMNLIFGEMEENSHLLEFDRTRQCLNIAVANLQTSFQFQLPTEITTDRIYQAPVIDTIETPFRPRKEPDFKYDEDGRLRLTTMGRRQLLNANRRFDFTRLSWPSDLKAISYSIEIPFLAMMLRDLSSLINSKYGKNLEILYRQPRGVVPWVFRRLLEPPTRLVKRNSPVVERYRCELKARVNLRPLASYWFLVRFWFSVLSIGLILGFPTVFGLIFIGVAVFLFICLLILNYHPSVRAV